MRFAALQGSGASDYINAGKAAADSAVKGFAINRKYSPDYGEIAKTGMKTRSAERIAATRASASVTKAGINAVANVTKVAIGEKAKDKVRGIKGKVKMAGAIAGLGRIAGAGYLASKDNTKGREIPSNTDAKRDLWNKHMESLRAKNAERDANRTEYKPSSTSSPSAAGGTNTSTSSGSGETAGKVVGGGSANGTDPLAGLTSKDYADMAYTISSEAALGTDDVYGVAANLVTRLRSGKYGDSIHAISHAPGQYEGVYTGRSVASPKIAAQLQSPEGMQKIRDFYNQLDGRTEFKGQSMLHNRVAKEDPMFDPKGNFYHYSGQ